MRLTAALLAVLANATFSLSPYSYFPGSRIPVHADGLSSPRQITLFGAGTLSDDILTIPRDATTMQSAFLVGASRTALASSALRIAAQPDAAHAFIAVASYDTGIVLHEVHAPFAPIGTLGIGGAPSDVAIGRNGLLAAADTTGDTATAVRLSDWSPRVVRDVPVGDEVTIDDRTNAIYVSDRDFPGGGAITRIDESGVSHFATQETPEGLALDQRRGLLYVANVNSGTVSVFDTATSRIRATFQAVERDFSLALSDDGSRLYVVSNESLSSPFARAGGVVAFDVTEAKPRPIARSAALTFPLGVAFDQRDRRIFVTDEENGVVYVLDATTLHATHAPLATCRTPWTPEYDAVDDTLYVPCAASDEIDVFDAHSLARRPGAPFATGNYPLAVAVWHPR